MEWISLRIDQCRLGESSNLQVWTPEVTLTESGELVERHYTELSVEQQYILLGLFRSGFCYMPKAKQLKKTRFCSWRKVLKTHPYLLRRLKVEWIKHRAQIHIYTDGWWLNILTETLFFQRFRRYFTHHFSLVSIRWDLTMC